MSRDRKPFPRKKTGRPPHRKRPAPAEPKIIHGPAEGLFQLPGQETIQLLDAFSRAVDRVSPLKSKHRATLHRDVRDLSQLLTAKRARLQIDYLRNPVHQSAYLRYFLPMNLIRLATLLAGLTREGCGPHLGDGDIVWDLGSGPLTLPQALWIARPDLRDTRLTFLCMDVSRQPMALGRDILQELMGDGGWTIRLIQGRIPQDVQKLEGPPALITMANLLNELDWPAQGQVHRPMQELVQSILSGLDPAPPVLVVEPGTRLGGKLASTFRDKAIEVAGLHSIAPCPHDQPCPMLAPRANSWCHFTFEAGMNPTLRDLALRASLVKERLALSFCLLGPHGAEHEPGAQQVRILSAPFSIPGPDGRPVKVVYGCAGQGLVVCAAERGPKPPPQGTLTTFTVPESRPVDSKSRLPIVLAR